MKNNLSELFASLPQEENEKESGILDSVEAQEQLQAIFADLAYRPVPVHSLQRMWTLGELSTQVALAYGSLWLRGFFADADTKRRKALETNLRVALKMIHRLGYLRGAATKLGQAFGSLPELLPEQVVSTLEQLHAQAPPMHFSLIREVLRDELGKEPSDFFATFDKEPFAAASIGQVHRATLKTGEDVAVKIQYPGIGRAMHADVRNLMALVFPMRLSREMDSIRDQVGAMRDMLEQEIDYEQEARNMLEARAHFSSDDGIVVPKVFEHYSSRRVLTAGYLPGPHLGDFLKTNPSQELRDAFGSKISRAWFRMYFANASYADPHSGNYVFMNDGQLGLLDFGCIQRFTADELRILERSETYLDASITLEEHLRDQLPQELRDYGHAARDLANETYMAPIRRHLGWLIAPVFHKGPFDFGDTEYFRQGIDSMKEMIEKRYPSPAMYLYIFRSIFGLRVLSWRLKCRVDFRSLRREERQRRSHS